MIKAQKLPSGSWRVRVVEYTDESGKRHVRSITRPTKREAELAAAELAAHPSGRCLCETFRAALTRYIKSRDKVLSPTTITGYTAILRRGTDLDGMDVSRITEAHIQRYINRYAETHSPKTTRNVCALISAAMRFARPGWTMQIALPQKRPPAYTIPQDADIKRLLEVSEDKLKIAILLAATVPMRRGEVCAVKYEDIQDGVLHIHATMAYRGSEVIYKETAKTSAGDRRVKLSAPLLRLIDSGEGYLIGWCPNRLYDHFKRACKRAGVNFRFHDLRHYGASALHSLGVPDSYIMERGGWESDTVLKSVYRHTLSEESKHFAEVADNKFNSLM